MSRRSHAPVDPDRAALDSLHHELVTTVGRLEQARERERARLRMPRELELTRLKSQFASVDAGNRTLAGRADEVEWGWRRLLTSRWSSIIAAGQLGFTLAMGAGLVIADASPLEVVLFTAASWLGGRLIGRVSSKEILDGADS